MSLLSIAVVSLLLLTGMSQAVFAQTALRDDSGTLVVYLGDRVAGTESFSFRSRNDTLEITSMAYQKLPSGDRRKQMLMLLSRPDLGLYTYVSNDTLPNGNTMIRGVSSPSDTTVTVYREVGLQGEGDRLVLPPGRLFVLDQQIFVLFDFLVRSLHAETFSSRPINLLALSTRDTVIEGTVTDLGRDTLRWGARPVQARKLRISDGTTTFMAWTHPDGRMLRLAHASSGLRVERDPPPVKKPSTTP